MHYIERAGVLQEGLCCPRDWWTIPGRIDLFQRRLSFSRENWAIPEKVELFQRELGHSREGQIIPEGAGPFQRVDTRLGVLLVSIMDYSDECLRSL